MGKRTCIVGDCTRLAKARGLCNTHYERVRAGRLALSEPIGQYNSSLPCAVADCVERRRDDASYCPMHRMRIRRHGSAGEASRSRAKIGQATWDDLDIRRRYRLANEYGLTAEDYEAILKRQKGRCAVCGSKDPRNRPGRSASRWNFCVDHDHTTGQIRGLLCSPCNRAIGMLGDDPDTIRAAASYIRAHRQQQLFGPFFRAR